MIKSKNKAKNLLQKVLLGKKSVILFLPLLLTSASYSLYVTRRNYDVDYEVLGEDEINGKVNFAVDLDREKIKKYKISEYLTSASFNFENAKLWIKHPKNNGFDYKLTDVSLDSQNYNVLILTYTAKSLTNQNQLTKFSKKILIKNSNTDVNLLVRSIKDSYFLDDYFDFNYDFIGSFGKNLPKATENERNLDKFLTQKTTIFNNFFKILVKPNANIKILDDGRISVESNILFNSQVIKTVNLVSKNKVDFSKSDDFNLKINYTNEFLNSSFYKNTWLDDVNYRDFDFSKTNNPNSYFWSFEEPIGAGGLGNYWFYNSVLKPTLEKLKKNKQINENKKFSMFKPQINVVSSSFLGVDSPTDPNELTKKELDLIFNDFLKSNNFFKIEKPDNVTVEFSNFTVNNQEKRVLTSATNKSISFKLIAKKGTESREIILNFAPKEFIRTYQNKQDKADESKILEIIADKTGKKLFQNTKIKNLNDVHGNYSLIDSSENLVNKFNSIYSLPKIGRYQIFAKEIINKNNVKGESEIFFWYTQDGIEIPIITKANEKIADFKNKNKINIKNWKPAQYQDIKPLNKNNFSKEDFKPIKTSKIDYNTGKTVEVSNEIDQKDKEIIDKINSRHFEYRGAGAEIINKKQVFYSLVDVDDIVEQKAENMLNYVLNIKNSLTDEIKDKNKFKNETVGIKVSPDGSKINTESAKLNSPDINRKEIFDKNDTNVQININKISKDYFLYFYDVKKGTEKGSLQFKLGFINKKNTNIRYSTEKVINLFNLVNEFKSKLYPEIILNKIKFSDLIFKNQNYNINDLKANNFWDFIDLKKEALNYNNFEIDKSKIHLSDVKYSGKNGYFRLKYVDGKTSIIGSNWYHFTNLATNNGENRLEIDKNKTLVTVFESANTIRRFRQVEPYFEDLIWSFNKSTKEASWIFKEKYISETLLKQNTNKRKIYLHLFGNALVQNFARAKRIIGGDNYKGGYDFEFDFEKLIKDETIEINSQTENVYFENSSKKLDPIEFIITAKYLKNQGIQFKFKLKDPKFGLILDDINKHLEPGTVEFYNSSRFDAFDQKKAFLLHLAAANVQIDYQNNLENEDFHKKTNSFDYKNIDFNQENQPITFYNPEANYDLSKYNPNQNVHWKLHEGYLLDNEFAHKNWDSEKSELIKNIRARTFGFSYGSATMLAKVNDNPNDGKFYIITNNHVEGGRNFELDKISGQNLPYSLGSGKYMSIAGPNYANNVDDGFSYWSGQYHVNNVNTWLLWTGTNQLDKQGKGDNFVDISVLIIDINPLIEEAKSKGEFLKVAWLKNWFNLPKLNLELKTNHNLKFYGPNIKSLAMNGFPYGRQNGYIINRAQSDANTISLLRQNGYTQTFFNPGNSGTGLIGLNNSYVATINSGVPLDFLQSFSYENLSHNYFGLNEKGENPINLNNTNSLAAKIMQLNAKDPLNYSLPWYFKTFK